MYNYLFFKGYQLAKKSKYWEDTPILFATMLIAVCLILNLATLIILAEILAGRNFNAILSGIREYGYVVSTLIVVVVYFHYSSKKVEKILTKYEIKERSSKLKVHPAFVLIVAFVLSALLCSIAGMYKNSTGIFGG